MTQTLYCAECGYEPPCIYGKCVNMGKPGQVMRTAKEKVLRCPNANDSCTYPDCNHILKQEEKETEMAIGFSARKANGDPLAAIRDIVKSLTYDEMMRLANGLSVDPNKLNAWAQSKDMLALIPQASSTPTNPVG